MINALGAFWAGKGIYKYILDFMNIPKWKNIHPLITQNTKNYSKKKIYEIHLCISDVCVFNRLLSKL